MNLKSLATTITSGVGKQMLLAKKHSPSIMFATGVVGFGATVVLACRSTLKVEPILDELDNNLAQVDRGAELNLENYTERDQQKDRVIAYTQAAVKLGKLYALPIIVGGASVALLTGSHVVLNNRFANVTAAYAALEKTYNAYRRRVVGELGEEKERELRYGVDEREVLIETEHGPEVTRDRRPAGAPSEYAFYFDKKNQNWSPQPEYNLLWLRAANSYFNNILNSRGHLLLNDLYDYFGEERTDAGCVVGWVKDNPRGGDGYVDLGIWDDTSMEALHHFISGYDGGIWIDPNADGVVYDLIGKKKG